MGLNFDLHYHVKSLGYCVRLKQGTSAIESLNTVKDFYAFAGCSYLKELTLYLGN